MRPVMLAVTIAGLLLAASLAGLGVTLLSQKDGTAAAPAAAGADEALLHHGMAGDHATSQPGMDRPAFPMSEGSVPTESDARSMEETSRIRIVGDEGFVPANGIREGSGTLADPYVISGYYVTGDLYLQDTDACVEIKDNFIGGQLSLNWNGPCVFVHHNFIRDLRVNENIHRLGYATGGLLEQNKIEYIGQLRHYDGEFRHNVVGPRGPASAFDEVLETVPFLFTHDPRVANVDGFNQGLIHHNTFSGSVDLDWHGHHHGTGFFAPHSHYHGEDMDSMSEHDHDHTDRWTSVAFTDNKIVDPEGYGLRFDDQNHAGDDRTANSEQVEELEMPHVHHLYVEMNRNVVEGAPIWVDVFIADDRLHEKRSEGWLDIHDNTVTVNERVDKDGVPLFDFGPYYHPSAGISVSAAKETEVSIRGNTMKWVPADKDDGLPVVSDVEAMFAYQAPVAGIYLDFVRDAEIEIQDNSAEGFEYGVHARELAEDVTWTVLGNDFDAPHPVYYDESVANAPETDE